MTHVGGWLDLNRVTNPLIEAQMTGAAWAHLATAVGLWIVLPAAVGVWRTMRHEFR